jgi:hypothetical protein
MILCVSHPPVFKIKIGYGAAGGDCLRVRGRAFREVFDSQFDSHGLGQGRIKGTRAEIKSRCFV